MALSKEAPVAALRGAEQQAERGLQAARLPERPLKCHVEVLMHA